MIVDTCTVFGCDRLLTATEKLYGNKCFEHSGDPRDAIVSRNKYETLRAHLMVTASHFEREANELRKYTYYKSPVIVAQRESLIAVCDDACALILKLLNI